MIGTYHGTGLSHVRLRTEIRRHHAAKQCLFVEDIQHANRMFVDGCLKGPFTGMHTIEGVKITLVYNNGKLLTAHTMTRRNKSGSDLLRFFLHCNVIPFSIPHQKGIVYVFGVLAMSVDDKVAWCGENNMKSVRGERSFTKITFAPTEKYTFFPYSTTALKKSFLAEFVQKMEEFGCPVPFAPEPVVLPELLSSPEEHIYTIPKFYSVVPKHGMVECNGAFYHWGGYLVRLDEIKRWKYPSHKLLLTQSIVL